MEKVACALFNHKKAFEEEGIPQCSKIYAILSENTVLYFGLTVG